jgi:hypothetical protein
MLWWLHVLCGLRATATRGDWQNRSSVLAVPLSRIQGDILRLLAAQRNPESYVAGASPLIQRAPRISNDIDLYHDRAEQVAVTAVTDTQTLTAAGFGVSWLRQMPLMYTAGVTRDGASTRLEWVADSDYRFFPTVRDEIFGYTLHPADLAMNKVMAAAGRRELRDLVDLVTIHERILSLGAVIWAAVEKSPGFTPEGLIAEIRRNGATHSVAEWQGLQSTGPLDPKDITARLRAALDQAEAFVMRMPTDKLGLLFLDDTGHAVQPDPNRLDAYWPHAGQRRGQWPDSPEIRAAMLERYNAGLGPSS